MYDTQLSLALSINCKLDGYHGYPESVTQDITSDRMNIRQSFALTTIISGPAVKIILCLFNNARFNRICMHVIHLLCNESPDVMGKALIMAKTPNY
jgi:hypothetical protein